MKLTLLLIAINVLVFFYTLPNLDYYASTYGFSVHSFLSGRYESLLTSMFIHASVMHIFGNMLALFFLGWTVEKNSRWWQYLVAYFVAGIGGAFSMFLLPPSIVTVGASAAISGIVGLGVFMCPTKFVLFPEIIPLPFVLAGAIYLITNVTGLLVPSDIGYAAHITGFAIGALMGLKWGGHSVKRLVIFLGTLAAVVAAFYFLGLL